MSTKTLITADPITGEIAAGDVVIDITDPSALVSVVVDGMVGDDYLDVLREGYDADDFSEPYTDGRGWVQVNVKNNHFAPSKAGKLSFSGVLAGSVIIFTEAP